MSQSLKLWAVIAAIGIAPYSYAGPAGRDDTGPAAPAGTVASPDMQSPQSAADDAQNRSGSPAQLLEQNTKLSENLQKLLPPDTTPQQACSGFTQLGSCVAAVHVAHNLNIPFADLKPKVTGSGAESLDKAIRALKPDADAKAEMSKAEGEARADLRT